jgi:hypothetical protein
MIRAMGLAGQQQQMLLRSEIEASVSMFEVPGLAHFYGKGGDDEIGRLNAFRWPDVAKSPPCV